MYNKEGINESNVEYIEVTGSYVPVKEFLEFLISCKNVIRIANLGHQAGCPIYLIETSGGYSLTWHTSKDEEEDAVLLKKDNKGNLINTYKEQVLRFETLEDITNDLLAKHMIGNQPFRDNTVIYDRCKVRR